MQIDKCSVCRFLATQMFKTTFTALCHVNSIYLTPKQQYNISNKKAPATVQVNQRYAP